MSERINKELETLFLLREKSGSPRTSKKHNVYWLNKKYWTTAEAALLLLFLYEEDIRDYPPADTAFEKMEHEIARAIVNEEIKSDKKDKRFGNLLKPSDVIRWAHNNEMTLAVTFSKSLKLNKKQRGRPSAKPQILKEVKRRNLSKEMESDWKDECKYLLNFSKGLSNGNYEFESIKNIYPKNKHDLNVTRLNKNK